jgi:CHAD domain-containing protein
MGGKGTDMSYHFTSDDKSVQAAVRRVALDQIDAAVAEIDNAELPREKVVHQVRKRCKKLRALVRLVRPGFDDYARENTAFRDLARTLGGVRDQDVLIETCNKIGVHYGKDADAEALQAVRCALLAEKQDAANSAALDERLAVFRDAMLQARHRAPLWIVRGDGFAALSGGLQKTLKQADKAMAAACGGPTADNMHEWRKHVKYHWYHARLLRSIWPDAMQAHVAAASELADLLGDHHDLTVLRERLRAQPHHYGGTDAARPVEQMAAGREEELTGEVFRRGALLQAEAPKALARRWERYWHYWRGEG